MQRNCCQLKEPKKHSEKNNEIERNNLPDKEFKALVIRMLNELGKRIDEQSENFNKKLVNIF